MVTHLTDLNHHHISAIIIVYLHNYCIMKNKMNVSHKNIKSTIRNTIPLKESIEIEK